MKRMFGRFLVASTVLLAVAGSAAAADTRVVVTREESKPASVEVKTGEEVRVPPSETVSRAKAFLSRLA